MNNSEALLFSAVTHPLLILLHLLTFIILELCLFISFYNIHKINDFAEGWASSPPSLPPHPPIPRGAGQHLWNRSLAHFRPRWLRLRNNDQSNSPRRVQTDWEPNDIIGVSCGFADEGSHKVKADRGVVNLRGRHDREKLSGVGFSDSEQHSGVDNAEAKSNIGQDIFGIIGE